MSDYFEMSEGMGPCILGIDPGMKGALGFFFPAVGRVAMEDTPFAGKEVNAPALIARIKNFRPEMCVLESVHAMKGQGVSSSFNFGMSFGQIRGVICALNIPLYLVTPQKWKKFYSLDSDKEKSRAKAIQLFPHNADRLTLKKHEGRAEAALLAKYGAENYWNGRFSQAA
jgi:hypothetical protein